MANIAQAADNYYFRLRPSVSILNQEPFSVHIVGDHSGVVGSSFSAKAEASSPRETLRFQITDGNLPEGVNLDHASGAIYGHPKVRGIFRATVTASDAFSTASAPLDVQVYDAIDISTLIPQYGTVGLPYSASFKGTGGDLSFTWSLTGTPPTGLSLGGLSAPVSSLSGVPTTPGTWGNLRINVTDGTGHSSSTSTFSIAIANQLKVSGNPTPFATVGEAYSTTISSTGGHEPIFWSLIAGNLPNGLSLSNGIISGIPTEPGIAVGLIVKATDKAMNSSETNPFSITVSQPLKITGSPSSIATVGSSYSVNFIASGGDGNYVWSKSGKLPESLSFANGTISGTPSVIETVSDIEVSVVDGNGRSAKSKPFSIAVSKPLSLSGTPSSIATIDYDYEATFSVSGGDGNYKWTVESGTLPTGLSLKDGSLSGKPTASGTWSNIAVSVSDGDGRATKSKPFSIVVSPQLTIVGEARTSATVGDAYTASFNSTGGAGGNVWRIVSGTLPKGLTLDKDNGTIAGFPTMIETTSDIVVQVEDINGRKTQSAPFSIRVSNPLLLEGSLSPNGTIGSHYSSSLSVSGGSGNYNWSIVSGPLPDGLTLSNGSVTGSPSKIGTYSNVIIRVTDSDGRTTQTPAMSFAVYHQISISGSTPWQGTVSVGYSGYFSASNGDGNYHWSIISGSLPDGLWISNGTIGGTPSRSGVWNDIIIRVSDNSGRYADSASFSIYIYEKMSMDGGITNSGKVGQYFRSSISAYGGRGPYDWAIVSGTIPPGLSLSEGVISGTPTTAGGPWYFSIRARDKDGRYVDSPTYGISIAANIIREPASGEASGGWVIFNTSGGGASSLTWNGVLVGYPPVNSTVFAAGGATYYRGSSTGCQYIRRVPIACGFNVYRTIP